jgi:hypothetical protein
VKTGETAVGDEKIGYAEDNHVRKQTRGIYTTARLCKNGS